MKKEEYEKFREILQEMRRSVGGEYARAREESTEAFGDKALPDMADEASRTIERRITMQMSDKTRARLQQIDDALARIDAGDYGECLECGAMIPNGRLELLPYALHCVACKEALEKEESETA